MQGSDRTKFTAGSSPAREGRDTRARSGAPPWHHVRRLLETRLRIRLEQVPVIHPLAGDASLRSYYRAALPGMSLIIAVFPPSAVEALDRQLDVYHALADGNSPVPRIFAWTRKPPMLISEDLGDLTLSAYAVTEPEDNLFPIYRELIRIWRDFQQLPGRLPENHPILARRLDARRFTYELEYFITHFLLEWAGISLSRRDFDRMTRACQTLAEILDQAPRGVCHRDLHSRNVLIHRGRPWLIDYQDMQMGPLPYDPASLLLDCYRRLPRSWIDSLRRESGDEIAADEALWKHTALQRHLKALGTFGYQIRRRGNRRYLSAIHRTLGYVLKDRELDAFPPLRLLQPMLEDIAARKSF